MSWLTLLLIIDYLFFWYAINKSCLKTEIGKIWMHAWKGAHFKPNQSFLIQGSTASSLLLVFLKE